MQKNKDMYVVMLREYRMALEAESSEQVQASTGKMGFFFLEYL